MKSVGYAAAPGDTPTRQPNCGVVTVAILCGIPHATAWEKVKKAGGYGARWKGRTFEHDRSPVLKEYGVETTYASQHFFGLTITKFAGIMKPGVVYMVETATHIQIMLNGRCYDQNHQHGAWPANYGSRRDKIVSVREVISGPLIDSLRDGDA